MNSRTNKNFQQRFKGKQSKIGRHGELGVSQRGHQLLSRSVDYEQVHIYDSPLRKSAQTLLSGANTPSRQAKAYRKDYDGTRKFGSAEYNRKKLDSNISLNSTQEAFHLIPVTNQHNYTTNLQSNRKRSQMSFVPYTISDYKRMTNKKLILGGIGPASVGTEDWKAKKQSQDRMLQYADNLRRYKDIRLHKQLSL